MKNSKLYFILSMITNVLFFASLWVLISKPFRFIDVTPIHISGGGITRDIYTGLFGSVVILAPFVLLLLVILLVLWGALLASIGKIRNKMVIIGLIACLISFSVTAVLLLSPLECPWYLKTQSGTCLSVN